MRACNPCPYLYGNAVYLIAANERDAIVIDKKTVVTGMALVCATVGAGVVGATAPAQAADYVIFLATGQTNDAPPVRTVGGLAIGLDADQASANQISLTNCVKAGGHQCVVVVNARNACAATAANDFGQVTGASDTVLKNAEDGALRQLDDKKGAHIVVSGCANGFVPPTSPPPAAPAPPKLGPTLTFDPVIGGLVAHIADRSGVTSKCTYATDNVNRSFTLQANATYDLRLVPAVPQFRNWTVTVTCDNGATTTATTFF